MSKHQFPKIRVDRHDDIVFGDDPLQQGSIARVRITLSCFHHIMPRLLKPLGQTTTRTTIH
jgi:hypothetical protein